MTPPRVVERLLDGLSARTVFSDGVIGDLAEEFARRAVRDGNWRARRWYYREALRSAPHLVGDAVRSFRRSDVRNAAKGILAAWAVVLMAAITLRIGWPGVSDSFRFVLRLGGVQSDIFFAAMTIEFLLVLIGGIGGARFATRAPIITATVFGFSFACAHGVSLAAGANGMAFSAAVAALDFLAAAMGGVLHASASRPRSRV